MKISSLILALLTPLTTIAANNAADTLQLQELLVTAPIKTNIVLTPLDVTVINSEQIDKSTETSLLPVLMNHIPGFFVTERGMAGYGASGGSAGTVSIRGVGGGSNDGISGGNKVLFMIDGVPQWAGIFGHSNPDTYVANGVERVEVVKGPSSLLYGSGAMGGSVNIITRKQQYDGFSGKARAMFGSYYTQKFDLSTGFKKDKFSMTLSGQVDRSNGNRKNMEYWLANEFINMQYSASEHWNVGTNVVMTQTKAHNPMSIYDPFEEMWSKIVRGTGTIYVNNSYKNLHGGVQGFINWGHHDVEDGWRVGAEPSDYIFHLNDYNMGVSLFETINPWKDNNLSVGVDFQHWGGHLWNSYKETGTHYGSNSFNINEISGYIMMQQGFIHDLLSVNAGVRLQHNSVYGNEWVPQAGFIVRPKMNSEIKFSFGKGFRSPNPRELYLWGSANPDLKPESLLNYELSYRQHLLNGRLNFGVALFFIDGKDMIQAIDRHNINTGKFKNKGFEIDGDWQINNKWQAYLGYAYLHTDNKTILYAPKNKLDLSLTFAPGNFEFTLENNNIWSMRNGAPQNKTINYSLVNFRGAYTTQSRVPVTFFVKVDNIFDRHYEIVYGYPMPGITVMGGAEFRF